MTNEEFRHYYYDAMYDYTVSRKPEGITIARPYSHQGGLEASVEKMVLGWCGDFQGSWDGLKLQIDNIYRSAQYGYGAVGCEVGGFWGEKCNARQLTRYAQFGCMTACMINGGENGPFSAHLPWWHGKDVEETYRWCVDWMKELTPYKFSTLVDAHLHGGSLLKQTSLEEESHLLGNDIFTKVITTADGKATFTLPKDGEWIDFWTGQHYQGNQRVTKTYSLSQFPLFIRAGAIIPLRKKESGAKSKESTKRTFVIYPKGKSNYKFHLPKGDGTDYFDCIVSYDATDGRLKMDSEISDDFVFIIGDKTIPVSGSSAEITIGR